MGQTGTRKSPERNKRRKPAASGHPLPPAAAVERVGRYRITIEPMLKCVASHILIYSVFNYASATGT